MRYIIAIIALTLFASSVLAQSKRRAEFLRVVIEEQIETKDFTNPMTLKDVLGLLYEHIAHKGIEVPILVDTAAFKTESPDAADPYEANVNLPPVPRTLTVEKALCLILAKLPTQNATFVVNDRFVEVTTQRAATVEHLLKRKVLAQYVKRPLVEVLEDLSERSSVSIIVDPHLGQRAQQDITATFRNEPTVKEVLVMLARVAGLEAEFLPYGVFFTIPAERRAAP